jgi:alkylhydroperoxidase family enzyme
MLGFLQKLTLHPAEITPADVVPLGAAGLSDAAIEDAIYICAYFNVIDRIADSLHFDVPSPEDFARSGLANLQRGYLPSGMK